MSFGDAAADGGNVTVADRRGLAAEVARDQDTVADIQCMGAKVGAARLVGIETERPDGASGAEGSAKRTRSSIGDIAARGRGCGPV